MKDSPGPFEPVDVLSSLGDSVIATRLDGTVEFWNKAAEQLYGWGAEEAVGQNISDLCVPAPGREVADEIMQALRQVGCWTGGFQVPRKDGSVVRALVTVSGIYRDDELVGIAGVCVNLGSAVRALAERSTDAVFILRLDATVTYASAAVRQLFGWDEHDLLGKSIVPLVHAADRQELAAFLDQVIRVPGPRPPVELRVRTDDGWVWAEVAFSDLLDDPEVREVVCSARRSIGRPLYEAAQERMQQLQTALDSRVLIERAKGYLAANAGIDPDEAFQIIRAHARRTRKQTHEVCRGVLTGELSLHDDKRAGG